ncbi:hypothetical protein GGR56DRAFT_564410 [Xylariaceae sp. FL0804]|nr:hypothetical protein GGR56DRAFT_564410 [Xylariaceae sp. FL0804]
MMIWNSLSLLLGAVLLPSLAHSKTLCTRENAIPRLEYSSLTSAQQTNYVSAIQCIMAKPSLLHSLVPATTNKFDDYAAVHVNMTISIHIDGIFLAWHRHFVHLMEQELHQCGWPAGLGLPYWNWTLPVYASLETSPLFDGSATSLGGNGLYDPNTGPYVTPSGAELPHGSGGGCVTTGPFANRTVSFQPLDFSVVFSGLPANWSAASPHCMTRDLNDAGIAGFNNASAVAFLLAQPTVGEFADKVNGYGDSPGLHGGGHLGIGGTGYDFFGSPQDPAFYLHHAMLDGVWEAWQAADPPSRRYVYNGTSTIFNAPTTPEVVNETVLSYGVLGQTTVQMVQDPLANGYCYMYV